MDCWGHGLDFDLGKGGNGTTLRNHFFALALGGTPVGSKKIFSGKKKKNNWEKGMGVFVLFFW